MVAHCLDVDRTAEPRGDAAVALLPDDLAAVVDDHRLAAEGVDRRLGLAGQVVRAHVGGEDVHVVVEGTGPVLDLEVVTRCSRVGNRRAVHHLSAVQGQSAGVLRIRTFVGHHDSEPAERGVDDGPERIEVAPVALDPPVVHIVGAHRVLDGEQRRRLVVGEDQLALVVEDEPDVEVPPRPFGMSGLGLTHEVHAVLPAQLAERLGLGAGHVDRAGFGEGGVVEVQDLVVESLQRTLGKSDEAHRKVERREPRRRLHHVAMVIDVAHDLRSSRHAPHRRDQPHCVVRLDHRAHPSPWPGLQVATTLVSAPKPPICGRITGRGFMPPVAEVAPDQAQRAQFHATGGVRSRPTGLAG